MRFGRASIWLAVTSLALAGCGMGGMGGAAVSVSETFADGARAAEDFRARPQPDDASEVRHVMDR